MQMRNARGFAGCTGLVGALYAPGWVFRRARFLLLKHDFPQMAARIIFSGSGLSFG